METKIERDDFNWVRITGNNGAIIQSQTVEANLLLAILEKLEEVRCCIIDLEEDTSKIKKVFI